MKNILTYIGIVVISFTGIAQKDNAKNTMHHDFELELEAEYRYFYKTPSFEKQKERFPSLAFRPKYTLEWNKGYESITAEGFFRLDVDSERTHWDVRELYYQKVKNNWELSIGLKKIYWGVTESNHLVDIINQTDAVESFDGEQTLGQAMLQYSLNTNFGAFDFFYLPHHRARSFAGNKGRFRFHVVINKEDVTYESKAKEWRQDLAFRWSHYMGAFDIGISHFYGNGREPLFTFDPLGNINAFYPVINQTGLELQVTHDAFLWKLESIYRSAKAQDVFAFVAGLEYTFSNIDGNGLDIGVLGEYLYDDRDELALTALQNDIFVGSRIAFNDTQDTAILIGGMTDLESRSKIFSIEASRRIGSSWKAEIEARVFSNIDPNELLLANFKNDSFLRFTMVKYF